MAGQWSGTDWSITVDGSAVEVAAPRCNLKLRGEQVRSLRARRSLLRWQLCVDNAPTARLRGLRRSSAADLMTSLRRAAIDAQINQVVRWNEQVDSVWATAMSQQRWISREQLEELDASRPAPAIAKELTAAKNRVLLSPVEIAAVGGLARELEAEARPLNEAILAAELSSQREFFDRIEKSPLSDEQAEAVVCFDNRVQLLAAAGSGKTSVMVARAAYAVQRGFVRPDRILLLAFNKAAAAELQQRIVERFTAAGIDHEGVRASTFHSFGLSVIGRATGHKPRLASWLDAGGDAAMVERIVDELRDADSTFRFQWDLFRLLFAGLPSAIDEGTPDGYDPVTRSTGFQTMCGAVVKSAGERMIADYLYLNHVEFEYETMYGVRVSDETHSQYRPDFHYPQADLWHEHWALDEDGKPPEAFVGYAESMEWKLQTHRFYGTKLIESTWHDVVFGDGLARLRTDLTRHGIQLSWDPDREPAKWAKPLQHADLARLMRTFMAHVKSNSLDRATVEARARTGRRKKISYRTQLFLQLYWPIHEAWDAKLRAAESVDFEDMLVQAAGHLERGEADMGYDLILVDEFQDASQARARLVRGLLQRPGRYLLAVGDDWQAINRFAGADISVMLHFEGWFGKGPQLELTRTFRCPQTICDVASRFVQKNPRQFRKTVRSAQTETGQPVTLIRTTDIRSAVSRYLSRLSAAVEDGTVWSQPRRKVSVDILGRYGFDKDAVPQGVPANLHVTFRTAHGSKGLEADFIVIPRVVSGKFGFPSEIADDPVLALAMVDGDGYAHSEERRLFYVALTRARRQVTIVTEIGRESAFVVELLRDELIVPIDEQGAVETVELCQACRAGTMLVRNGRFGRYLECSRSPLCRHKRDLSGADHRRKRLLKESD